MTRVLMSIPLLFMSTSMREFSFRKFFVLFIVCESLIIAANEWVEVLQPAMF